MNYYLLFDDNAGVVGGGGPPFPPPPAKLLCCEEVPDRTGFLPCRSLLELLFDINSNRRSSSPFLLSAATTSNKSKKPPKKDQIRSISQPAKTRSKKNANRKPRNRPFGLDWIQGRISKYQGSKDLYLTTPEMDE